MLVACRLAGLSALEAHYAGVNARAQCGPTRRERPRRPARYPHSREQETPPTGSYKAARAPGHGGNGKARAFFPANLADAGNFTLDRRARSSQPSRNRNRARDCAFIFTSIGRSEHASKSRAASATPRDRPRDAAADYCANGNR